MSSENGDRTAPVLRLGGMALRNGLLIHGPTSWSAAARKPSGEIEVASGPKPVIAPGLVNRVPLLRGPIRLAEAFLLIPVVRLRLRSARLPFEDPKVVGTMLAASSLSRAIRGGRTTAGREVAQAALGLAPALVAPMLLLSAAGQLILDRLIESPGSLARGAVGIASVSLAAEMFAWSERNPDTGAARAFHRPGHEIQRHLATKEPTPEQLEVGVAALREILSVEADAAAEPVAESEPPLPT